MREALLAEWGSRVGVAARASVCVEEKRMRGERAMRVATSVYRVVEERGRVELTGLCLHRKMAC